MSIDSERLHFQFRPHRRHQEWLRFLRMIDHTVAEEKQIHIICDNYATHKHERVQRWLARHKRLHVHFTPISGFVAEYDRALLPRSNRQTHPARRLPRPRTTRHAIGDYIDRQLLIGTAKANDILEKLPRARTTLLKV